jgi:hypothetical protein
LLDPLPRLLLTPFIKPPNSHPPAGDFLVLYADGHVSFVKRDIDRKVIRAQLRWNNKEMYPAP